MSHYNRPTKIVITFDADNPRYLTCGDDDGSCGYPKLEQVEDFEMLGDDVKKIGQCIKDGLTGGKLRDICGNTVGDWQID